ncbi:hypothetical protein [Sagittula salina]|uniref:Lipoprotein n=1 Tax=Sagittula salina TaxID=2820268 RepID=A0A940RZY5_9RHOB|nr:hypothetical protein [Sagittula salina]MBP0481487.1 hypothetical protein [Sagittula salina]
MNKVEELAPKLQGAAIWLAGAGFVAGCDRAGHRGPAGLASVNRVGRMTEQFPAVRAPRHPARLNVYVEMCRGLLCQSASS